VLLPELRRDVLDGFADDLKAPRARPFQHVVCDERVKVDAAGSFQ
jgi:hypothetical protein